jgi:SPP1 family predicted phage head-tail adaptor
MQLNKQVTVQRRAHTQDAAGQVRETWRDLSDVWASIRPLGGREFYAASGQRAEITHEIVMRYGVDILPQDRIEADGRIFEVITPINVGERDRYLRVTSKERADV